MKTENHITQSCREKHLTMILDTPSTFALFKPTPPVSYRASRLNRVTKDEFVFHPLPAILWKQKPCKTLVIVFLWYGYLSEYTDSIIKWMCYSWDVVKLWVRKFTHLLFTREGVNRWKKLLTCPSSYSFIPTRKHCYHNHKHTQIRDDVILNLVYLAIFMTCIQDCSREGQTLLYMFSVQQNCLFL